MTIWCPGTKCEIHVPKIQILVKFETLIAIMNLIGMLCYWIWMDKSRQPKAFVFYWTVGSIKLNKKVIRYIAVWGQCTKGSWICTPKNWKLEVVLELLNSARESHTGKCCRLQMINSVHHFFAYDPGYSVLKIGSLSAHILHILHNHNNQHTFLTRLK